MPGSVSMDGLPDGWAWTTLRDACEKIQDGTHFSPKNQLAEGRFRYVTAKNVRPNGLDLSDITYLSEQDHRAIYERCDPRQGDVLLVKDGVNTGDACIDTLDEEISLLSSVCMLRPQPALLVAAYLRYFLLSPIGFRSLSGQMTGTAIKRIVLHKIRTTPVPLAPIAEQRRLVALVDELLSDLEPAIAALERVRATLKRYRASVLKAAVEGRLTADWRAKNPNVEPASELLKRILANRRKKWEADQVAKYKATGKTPPKGWEGKYVEPPEPDTTKLLGIPDGWCWATVGQLSEIQGGIQKQPSRKPVKSTYPILRVANVHRDKLDLVEIHQIELFGNELERLRLEKGDMLIVEGNGSRTEIGRSAIWDGSIPDCVHQNHLIRVRFLAGLPTFLNVYWNSPSGSGRVMEQAASTSGLYTLSVSKVSLLSVPLPPLAEQEQIVAEVEERLSVTAAAARQVEADLARAARLRQAILTRAFTGKLVPQDPSDEPAAKLLERIAQHRGSADGSNGTRADRRPRRRAPKVGESRK